MALRLNAVIAQIVCDGERIGLFILRVGKDPDIVSPL